MQTDITEKQNEENQLRLLYAYHQAYSQVNRLAQIRFALVVATAVSRVSWPLHGGDY
ncbi:MAG: S-4TM family putative pore-forming effector [Pirellulaceae bacterium]|nr:S-4TM family putative pore-forming effector [Pirellulaceae bacterium]